MNQEGFDMNNIYVHSSDHTTEIHSCIFIFICYFYCNKCNLGETSYFLGKGTRMKKTFLCD